MAKRILLPVPLFLLMIVWSGCGGGGDKGGDGDNGGGAVTPDKPTATKDEPFVLGDLVKEFSPPPLADLDAQAEWIDQPVLDSMELMRQRQAKEPELATVEEALNLRNTSPEINAKILSALGRLPSGDGPVNWDATINRHTAGDLKSTNPILASSTTEFDVSGLVGFGLFGFDWNFIPFAAKDVVTSWQTSKDRMYDKVVMRDDLKWSDGQPITAHDVAFSFKLIMSSKVPVPAQRSGTDKLKWIEAYDDHTVVFFHQEPLATNIWNVNFSVVPKHIYEKSVAADPTLINSPEHVKLEDNPVSGGAYVFSRRTRGTEIVLERREDWYMHNGKQVRDKPYFKTIRFVIKQDPTVALLTLKAGDLDEMALTPEQWTIQTNGDDFYKNNTRAFGLEWVEFHFIWNLKTPFFSDVQVRKAMAYAFDHEELLAKLRYGLDEPCNGPFHSTGPWAPKDPPKPYQRDVAMAEKLLDDADWIDHDNDGVRDKVIDGKSVPFEFSVLTSNRQDRIDICNLLRQNLGEIGIECNVRPMEFSVLQAKMEEHEFQAAFGGWGTGTDPDTSDNIWGTDEDRNYGFYSNPEVDRLFAAGRREFDLEKRREIYGQIHTITWEDQPYMWLYYRNAYYGFSKDLRGYVFSPRGPFNYGPGFSSFWKPAAQ